MVIVFVPPLMPLCFRVIYMHGSLLPFSRPKGKKVKREKSRSLALRIKPKKQKKEKENKEKDKKKKKKSETLSPPQAPSKGVFLSFSISKNRFLLGTDLSLIQKICCASLESLSCVNGFYFFSSSFCLIMHLFLFQKIWIRTSPQRVFGFCPPPPLWKFQ